MEGKKAFEIQFNWIFILVVGVLILLFFSVIVIKQKNVSESSAKGTVLRSMESIVAGSSITQDTTKLIQVPDSSIEVGCNRISLGDVSKQYQNMILFSPGLIKGDKIITQTLPFSEPYKSANLLYITSPKIRYILVGNDDFSKEINKTLPSELNKEFYLLYDASKIKNLNNYKVRLIFANTPLPASVPASLQKMNDMDVTALAINGNIETGSLGFYHKNRNNGWEVSARNSAYIGKSSLVGSVYSDSSETYECNMRSAFARLKLISSINIDRLNKLKDNAVQQGKNQCVNIYDGAFSNLNDIQRIAGQVSDSTSIFDIGDFIKISRAAGQPGLSAQNKELQKFSCPLVY